MAAVPVPAPPFHLPMVDGDGRLTVGWRAWIEGHDLRAGGRIDKINDAHATAYAAAPQTRQVIAGVGLAIGGDLTGNVGLALYKAMDAVANLPATAAEGDIAYALDGRKPGEGAGSGTGVPCWFSGGAWWDFPSGGSVAA